VEAAKIPAAFGATVDELPQAIVALPLLPQLISRLISPGILVLLLKMLQQTLETLLPVALPHGSQTAMPT
jgi:hypothetical protein